MTESEIIRDARAILCARLHSRARHEGRLLGVPCARVCPEVLSLPAETVLAMWDETTTRVGGGLAAKLGDETRRLRFAAQFSKSGSRL